jgi:hypothetical protein
MELAKQEKSIPRTIALIQLIPDLKNISNEILALKEIGPDAVAPAISKIEGRLAVEGVAYNKVFPSLLSFKDNTESILKLIVPLTERFLSLNNIKWTMDQKLTFALDLLEINTTWNVGDIVMFFKFVRQNKGNVKEMKVNSFLTPPQLLRYVEFYEEERSIVLHRKQKEEQQEKSAGLTEVFSTNIAIVQKDGDKPVPDEDGKIITTNLSKAANYFSEKMTDGVVPKNRIQKGLQKLQAKNAAEESLLSYDQRDKKKKTAYSKISKGANSLGKENE